MGLQDFGTMDANASLKQVVEELANLMDTLNFLLNGNLDVKNLRANSITADRLKASTITAREILADSITANEIASNAITTNELSAGCVTAGKISVSQLSAIAADMGTLTAGIIYGAYIATANGTYPRIEFSSAGNLLTAFADALNYLSIAPSIIGAPSIRFNSPSGTSFISKGTGSMAMISDVGLTLTAPGDINIDSSAGDLRLDSNGHVDINAPSGIRINGTTALAGTKVYYVSNTSGGAVTRKLTFTDGLLTSET